MKILGSVLIATLAVVGGCADGDSEVTAEPESAPAVTAAPEPTGGTTGEVFEVTFDGSECIVEGPSEVPPGEYAFLFTDVSELSAALFARNLVDGHTYQDALDKQEEAGGQGANWPRPPWAADVPISSNRAEIDLADNQQLLTVDLRPGTGSHFLAVYATAGPGIWLCAPLDVGED